MSTLEVEEYEGKEDMRYKVVYYTSDRKHSLVMGIFPTRFLAQTLVKAIED